MLSTISQEEGVYFKDINQCCQDKNKFQTSLLAKGKPTGPDLQQTRWAVCGQRQEMLPPFSSENPAPGNGERAIPTAMPAMLQPLQQWKAEQE